MDSNKLLKNVIWGVSAVVGLIVAEGVYRAGIGVANKRELIGDGEIILDETESINDLQEEVPF